MVGWVWSEPTRLVVLFLIVQLLSLSWPGPVAPVPQVVDGAGPELAGTGPDQPALDVGPPVETVSRWWTPGGGDRAPAPADLPGVGPHACTPRPSRAPPGA